MNTEEPPQQKTPIMVSDTVKQTRPSLPPSTINEKGQLVNCFGQLVNDKGHLVKEDGTRIHIRGSRGRGDRRNGGIKRANQERLAKLQLVGVESQKGYLQDKREGTRPEEKAETKKRHRGSSEEADITHHKRTRSAPEYSTVKVEYKATWEAQVCTVQAAQGEEERKEVKIKGTAHKQELNIPESRNNPQVRTVSSSNPGNGERTTDWGNDGSQDSMLSNRKSSRSGHQGAYERGYAQLPQHTSPTKRQNHIPASLPSVPRESRRQYSLASKDFKPPTSPRVPPLNTNQFQSSTQHFDFEESDTAPAARFLSPARKFQAEPEGIRHDRASRAYEGPGQYPAPFRGRTGRGGRKAYDRQSGSWSNGGGHDSRRKRLSHGGENGTGYKGIAVENDLADNIQQQPVSMNFEREAEVDDFDIDIYADLEPAKATS